MSMTAGDVIRQMSTVPPETLVVVAKDREANDLSPADAATPGRYLADTTWSGVLLDAEDAAGVACVVVWPVN